MLDLLFKDISIVDGSGHPAYQGSVGVINGKITFQIDCESREIIQGAGLTLCPGFIDAHSHDDFTVGRYPSIISKICQGVTSQIAGNCGDSTYPVDKRFLKELKVFANMTRDFLKMPYESFTDFNGFAEYVESLNPVLNITTLIGHNMLRTSVMGVENRAPTADELELMKSRIRDAMEQGAFGLSSGLVYIPGAYAELDELIELCKAMAPYGGIYATHMRSESDDLLQSVKDSIYVAETAGVPLVISHFKAKGRSNWGKSTEALQLINAAKRRGVKIMMDQYPYEASMSGVSVCISPEYFADGMDTLLNRLKDSSVRAEVAAKMTDPKPTYENALYDAGGFDGVWITSSPKRIEAEGKSIAAYAKELNANPIDVFFDLLIENEGILNGIFFTMDIEEVKRIYCNPDVVVGSDGLCFDAENKGHPRTWDTFIRTLTEFAEKQRLVSFEEAVHKQTEQPAVFWGLDGKGRIAEGYDADLVLLNRSNLKSVATYQEPNEKALGVEAVFVAGKCVYRDGNLTGESGGKVLRRR